MLLAAKTRVCRYLLQEAKAYSVVSGLVEKIMERRAQSGEFEEGMTSEFPDEGDESLTEKERKEWREANKASQKAERERKEFCKQLAAHPLLMDDMITVDIDVLGDADCFKENQLSILDFESVKEEFAKQNPPDDEDKPYGYREREEVRTFLKQHGFETHSSGGGLGGWDLGYSLNHRDADRFCATMWAHYYMELTTGVIRVLRKGRDPQIPGLSNWGDAEKFAKEHDVEVD